MKLKGKNITIMGLGRTGIALVKFFNKAGSDIFISEVFHKDKVLSSLEKIKDIKYKIEFGGHTEKIYKGRDLIVVSPGINLNLQVIKDAKEKGILVISEIELAYCMNKAKLIAVTGTNGKSTTSSLIYQILKERKKSVFLAGNIGNPVIGEIENLKPVSTLVAEVSTFQLEAVKKFHPHIGVLLNITPDHLDRHRNFKEYINCKMRLFVNQSRSDFAVLNADDKRIMDNESIIKSRKFYFSCMGEVENGVYFRNGKLYFKDGARVEELKVLEDNLKDINSLTKKVCNIYNLLAAITVCKILGSNSIDIKRCLDKFSPLKHRMNFVKNEGGVTFIDDSKGTNPGAVIATLNSLDRVVLIAGGKDKKCKFDELAEVIVKKVKFLILIGQASPRLLREVKAAGFKERSIYMAPDLSRAVKKSYEVSIAGDIVLLSPACASFDMFNSAEERGRIFQKLVRNYAGFRKR